MDVSGILRYASEKGFALDGFEVQNMFPQKTNWRELEGTADAASPTWLLLKLQLRRFLLSVVHFVLHQYATAPHVWFSPWGSLAQGLFGYQGNSMHYRERKCSVDELSLVVGGPITIAVALKYHEAIVPFLEDPPEDRKLADGTEIKVSRAQIEEVAQKNELKTETYWKERLQFLERLFDEASRVAEWAVRTPSVKTIVIFESSGQFASNSKQVFEALQHRQATIPVPLQRDMVCGFAGSPVHGSDCQLIWADSSQVPDLEPELFIAFDGALNGFPLQALGNAQVFAPNRRQLLDREGANLLDFIEGVKFYASKQHQQRQQQNSVIDS